MQSPITVNYTRDGDDWKLTASKSDQELNASAAGLIAARDKADQLIEKLATTEEEKTVVHLLDGDAFAFTEAYLHARLETPKPEESASEQDQQDTSEAGEEATAEAEEQDIAKAQ